MIRILSLFFLAFYVFGSLHASATEPPACTSEKRGKQPMQASLHEYRGQGILVLAGEIRQNSGSVVAPFIRRSSSYDEVWMCSNGGSVHGGKQIGEALSDARATVRTPNDYYCVSACTIAAMGGYARIIDPNGHFVIHASSAYSAFGFDLASDATGDTGLEFSRFKSIDCTEIQNRAFCRKIRAPENAQVYALMACAREADVYELNPKCAFFDTAGKNYRDNAIVSNALISDFLRIDPELVSMMANHMTTWRVESEIGLLWYYQKMLLDGQAYHIDPNGYSQLRSGFSVRNVYQVGGANTHARNLTQDVQALRKADSVLESVTLWQAILTDGELSLKQQLSDYIKANGIDLGPAGPEALKMYDAMRTCQIQSACELERHTAEALGYHNMYDYE